MHTNSAPDNEEIRRQILGVIHAHWKFFMLQGIIMMILGVLAVALPNISTLATTLFVGWLFVIGGVARTVSILRARRLPGFGWSLAIAVLAGVLGLLLILQPLQGMLTLTMVLIALFLLEGIAAILVAFKYREHLSNSGWMLFSGAVDLILVYLIWQGWPSTAGWAIGLLVGINMIFLGMSLLMTAIAARKLGTP